MSRKNVGIADLKAHLSAHLRDVRGGNALLIVDRGHPVAQVIPFGDEGATLQVRKATRPLAEFRFAKRTLGTDSLSVLLEDRRGRR
jgi:antitoxin (DNA-binding transcriptional repressor) of toxin-antitoxin stability system